MQVNIPLASYQLNDNIRKQAIKLFRKIFEGFLNSPIYNPEELVETSRRLQFLIWEVIAVESETQIMEALILSIKEIVSLSKYQLEEWEVNNMGKKLVKLIYDSDRKKNFIISGRQKMEEDIEEEVMQEKIELEENLQISIAEFLGILMKKASGSEMTLKLAVFLFEEIIPKVKLFRNILIR
jgi:hypothetical protein